MLLTDSRRPFLGFILYISGIWGKEKHICALKGSSVDLPCSAEHPTSSMNWYTLHFAEYKLVQKKLIPDGDRVTCSAFAENNFTLTINDLRESDEQMYCCRENIDMPDSCWLNQTKLQVTDLQVKVIPATEKHTVTLVCSTSCSLTETPAAYIWYKNNEIIYEDWSPWYQELVHSEDKGRYSCAIKGYKGGRAPEVSVVSVTSTCFSVTYAKGRMCSFQQKSEDETCSITFPTEVFVQRKPAESYVRMSCNTSCPLASPQTAYTWYQNRYSVLHSETQQFAVSHQSHKSLSCAVKGHEDLLSADICVVEGSCWSVNYARRSICALQGSSVNISSHYRFPHDQRPRLKFWYKVKKNGKEDAENGAEASGRVEYNDSVKNNHIMTIKQLRRADSAEYAFTLQTAEGTNRSALRGVTLVVTGLKVKFMPSAMVTEGQRVTLFCSTSCPLNEDTSYSWYLNTRPLTPPGNQNKAMVLDPVSSQHAGNYSCAVRTHNLISSRERTLTVQALWKRKSMGINNAVRLAAVLLIPLPLLLFHIWLRRRRTLTSTAELKEVKDRIVI